MGIRDTMVGLCDHTMATSTTGHVVLCDSRCANQTLRWLRAHSHFILVFVSMLAVAQYDFALIFGTILADLADVYGLTEEQCTALFGYMNMGVCTLGIIPGVLYDRLGGAAAMTFCGLCAAVTLFIQYVWRWHIPSMFGTMPALAFIYVLFGMGASGFSFIPVFAPLEAFSDKHIGKVSSLLQICLALGMTVHAGVYAAIRYRGGDFIGEYIAYMMICFVGSSALMVAVFMMRAGNQATHTSELPEEAVTDLQDEASEGHKRGLVKIAMWVFFYVSAVGLSYSYLDVVPAIAAVAGLQGSSLDAAFGILSGAGRLLVSFPVDRTRSHPLGGTFSYVMGACFFFLLGLLWLLLPATPSAFNVYVANGLVAIAYGGINGIVPLALKLDFGSANIGLIYSVLTTIVSFAMPVWATLMGDPKTCVGAECYRTYCVAGIAALVAVILLCSMRVSAHFTTQRKGFILSPGSLGQALL
eukprot:NODE_5554_length_1757_cov_12.467485.p1 GENE.NODE_5554_length_1757_cov_12.467485~~NODE_5554_length_1757_cov_12.467485.p1  ORF type:complete len:471 (+),score=70.43 NODE_5554_length_1757_cov_12.467485:58-1470(+)